MRKRGLLNEHALVNRTETAVQGFNFLHVNVLFAEADRTNAKELRRAPL
jgi:hypothetical protein